MDNPGYFIAFLAVGCLVVGIPWATANRIIAAVRTRWQSKQPQPAPINHELRAQHLSNVIGPMDHGKYDIADILHLRTISEQGALNTAQIQHNIGAASKLAANLLAEQPTPTAE